MTTMAPTTGWMATVAAGARTADVVRVFEHEPDLLDGLDARSTEVLRHRACAPALWIEPGAWDPASSVERPERCLGLLVLDGLVTRSVLLDGRECPELVGPGDLLRPWDEQDDASVVCQSSWRVLERTTIAVLDERFATAICHFPPVVGNLLGRGVQRARTLAFLLAVAHVRHADTRLLMLLWHLADRWGRVTPQGVVVPCALTHELLGRLVCMRRPTASTALQRLRRSGAIERRPDGSWLLLGEPPAADEVSVATERELVAA